jgi:uncharacterized membrane protein
MSKTEDFLTKAEEKEVIEAIVLAEKNTSGEIRVHLEEKNDLPVLDRAKQVFEELHMHQTAAKNGVLFYVCMQTKSFAILGDEGIDKVVPKNFWESTKEIVLQKFKKGKYKKGLIKGIENAGEQLKKYFPYNIQTDTNELPNEISRN